jgi:hypothetical protein
MYVNLKIKQRARNGHFILAFKENITENSLPTKPNQADENHNNKNRKSRPHAMPLNIKENNRKPSFFLVSSKIKKNISNYRK